MNGPIIWDVDPTIFTIGSFTLKYYSLLFGLGILFGYQAFKRINKNLSQDELDKLLFYVFIGIVLGARIGHCIFYEPEYYLAHPLEMILPIQITEDGIQFTGFHGLASHGGMIGVLIAVYIFAKKNNKSVLRIMDKICSAGIITGACIRLGNFMNSEIIGKATGGDYGVVFAALNDPTPRHPAQLYESFGYFIMFFVLMYLFKKYGESKLPGFYMGLFCIMLFFVRFFIEFFKINQVAFEESMPINMGQILTIPFLFIGLYFVFRKNPSVNIS